MSRNIEFDRKMTVQKTTKNDGSKNNEKRRFKKLRIVTVQKIYKCHLTIKTNIA